MISDPIAEAGLVTREIRSANRDGVPTKVAVARRTYATDRAELWDAVTNSARIPRWFLPVTGDFRVGGRFQVEGNAGGVVERCDEPSVLAVTWEYGPMVSWLVITLTAVDGGTNLELAHEAPIDPDMWDQFGPGAVGVGWDLALMGLGLHLESGAAVDHEAAAGFTLTADGRAFVQRAAAAWADAAVGDEDGAVPAHEAAARTVAFYTTAPEDGPTAG